MTTQTHHQTLSAQIAEDLSQATRIQFEVDGQIDAATARALDAIYRGLHGDGAAANAGRIAMGHIDRAVDLSGQILAQTRNLRRPMRMAQAVTPAVASGLGGQLAQIIEYRDRVDAILERADRALAKAAAA